MLSAKAAGLRYVNDAMPGIRRESAGEGFRYVGPDGRLIRDPAELQRIKSLAIPPAWTRVWISPVPEGHLQATGRDARGRKQYRYHPRWRETRDYTKYHHLLAFGQALPQIRARTEQDLVQPGLPRQKVLAAVVQLLEKTSIRVGNDEYARTNNSFGLTTLRDRHVDVSGASLRFEFRGKSGKHHRVNLSDRRLAHIVKRCRDLPGQELFRYVDDDGNSQLIGSADVNAYLNEIAGREFTSKDFRTWAGTVIATQLLQRWGACSSKTEAKRNVTAVIECVAKRLGNTASVCRKCYIHPEVIEKYLDGTMSDGLRSENGDSARPLRGLRPEEAAVLLLLQNQTRRRTRAS